MSDRFGETPGRPVELLGGVAPSSTETRRIVREHLPAFVELTERIG